MAEGYTLDDLRLMRVRLINAFVTCFGGPLNTSKYENDSYTKLRSLLQRALGWEKPDGLPKENWFNDVFNLELINQQESKRNRVNSALDAYEHAPFRLINGEKIYITENTKIFTLKGARIIDDDFKESPIISMLGAAKIIDQNFIEIIKSKKDLHSFTDFYLAKTEDDCQWYGVISGWDEPRDKISEIKEKISDCFSWKKSKVAAVIWGEGGSGTSTLLRKLALLSIRPQYKILWVDDVDGFVDELPEIGNKPEKYLIFIEDWFAFHTDKYLVNKFLNRINLYNNIRVVIGDRALCNRPYRKFVYDWNYFELLPDENERIIQRVLANNPIWQDAANNIFEFKSFLQSPLFLILFILGRVSDDIDFKETKDVYSLFREIIERDVQKINRSIPGLAKTIFYWSRIQTEYNVAISWEAFLKIAEFYNGGKITIELGNLSTSSHPIGKTLNLYIAVEPLTHFSTMRKFHFRHYLLVIDGFSQIAFEQWPQLDNNLVIEVLDILIQAGKYSSANALYIGMRRAGVFDNFATKAEALNSRLKRVPPFYFFIRMEGLLERIARSSIESLSKVDYSDITFVFALALFLFKYDVISLQSVIKKMLSQESQSNELSHFYSNFQDESFLLNQIIGPYILKNNLVVTDGTYSRYREKVSGEIILELIRNKKVNHAISLIYHC